MIMPPEQHIYVNPLRKIPANWRAKEAPINLVRFTVRLCGRVAGHLALPAAVALEDFRAPARDLPDQETAENREGADHGK